MTDAIRIQQQYKLGDLYDALTSIVGHEIYPAIARAELAKLCKAYGTENVRRMLLVLAEDLLS